MEPRMVLSRLMEQAKRLGAKAAEGLYEQSSVLTIPWERGSIGPPVQQQTLSIKIGVFLAEGREAWCELSGPSLEQLLTEAEAPLQQAIDRAQDAPPDPWAAPVDRYDIFERGLGLLDRRQAYLTMEDRREVIEDNLSGCRQIHPDLRVEQLRYIESIVERGYASTRGHSATERSSRFDASIAVRLGRNGRRHVQQVASRQFANIASMPFGADLGIHMAQLATPAPLPDKTLPLIVDAAVVAAMLRRLAPAFAATAIQDGSSFLARSFGQRLAAPRLHVIDDPGLAGALYSRAFDDRGVPPAPVVLLREGIASGQYLDPRSARQADLRPSGHVMGGQLLPSNLVVRPGNRSRNAIGMDLDDYLVLADLYGENSIDLATGRIEGRADVLVYRGHEYQGAAQGVPLSLPLATFLGAIVEIAGDQARYSEVDACSLVIEGIEIRS